jgi:hypothetical protein
VRLGLLLADILELLQPGVVRLAAGVSESGARDSHMPRHTHATVTCDGRVYTCHGHMSRSRVHMPRSHVTVTLTHATVACHGPVYACHGHGRHVTVTVHAASTSDGGTVTDRLTVWHSRSRARTHTQFTGNTHTVYRQYEAAPATRIGRQGRSRGLYV